MKPIKLNDVRLYKRKYSSLVEVDYLEPLFQRVDGRLIKDLVAFGDKYVMALAEYWRLVVPYQKVFNVQNNQSLSSKYPERERFLSKSVIESRAAIQTTLNEILESSLSFGQNTKIHNYDWDYVNVSNQEHAIVSYQKSRFVYSYARLYVDQNLFYFGIELYLVNEFEACAYQKVELSRFPKLVPFR